MPKYLFLILALLSLSFAGKAQIKVTSASGTYDSILSGTPLYYQYSWDDPLDEVRDSFKLSGSFRAFEVLWDSALVSEGVLMFISSSKPGAWLSVDATGWDLIDKGWLDTANYPNISPVMLSGAGNEVEWRGFGFARELDTLGDLPSTGSVKIRVKNNNSVDFIYGDFAMIRPDLCFEGFGGLRPSVTYFSGAQIHSWILFGDPDAPVIDSTLADTALNRLPEMGRHITVDFSKTNAVRQLHSTQIRVYPNPTQEMLQVQGSSGSDNHYRVIAIDGRILMEGKLSGGRLNVASLLPGYYFLTLEEAGYTYAVRFLKMEN